MSKQQGETDTRTFAPWRRGFILSSLVLAVGCGLLYAAMRLEPMSLPMVLSALGTIALGGLWFKSAFFRWNGKQIEQSSVRGIKMPDGWVCIPNRMLPGGGDIDLYLESPDGQAYAVEIKSLQNVVVKHAFLRLGKSKLVQASRKKLSDDPIPQTLRSAEAVNAKPVLWLPKSDGKTATVQGVTVVFGSRKSLYKAVGAKTGWQFF
jgi:hypothetical protein